MMKIKYNKYTRFQSVSLTILRILIGWHIFYEGIAKLLTPGWSSAGFLKESKWIFSDLLNWILSHPEVLKALDFLNIWGLILIGAGLILGLFIRIASLSGVFFTAAVLFGCSSPCWFGVFGANGRRLPCGQ